MCKVLLESMSWWHNGISFQLFMADHWSRLGLFSCLMVIHRYSRCCSPRLKSSYCCYLVKRHSFCVFPASKCFSTPLPHSVTRCLAKFCHSYLMKRAPRLKLQNAVMSKRVAYAGTQRSFCLVALAHLLLIPFFSRVNGSPKERVCVHSLMGIPCFIVVRWQKIRRKLDSRMLQLRMHLLSTEPQGHSRSFSLVCWGLIKALWIMLSYCELIKRPLSLNFAFASGATVRTLVKSICSCFQSIKFKLK